MNRLIPNRPSLRITRRDSADLPGDESGDQPGNTPADKTGEPPDFSFEVWSPFTGSYQTTASMQEALGRVDQLADLISRMWRQHHPKRAALTDPPGPAETDSSTWAEFRVNPTEYPSYETRRFDLPSWVRAQGKNQATDTVCKRVGYVPPGDA